MDAINFENQTSLAYTDFTFGAPEITSLVNSSVNTKIRLTPNIGTLYYNPKDFYYERMDLGVMYSVNKPSIAIGSRVFLSELIPEINAFYGINLTSDDYIEQTLPEEDPGSPGAQLVVMLQMNATSILFQGVAAIVLNEAPAVIDEDNYDRRTYVLVDSETTTIYTNNIVAYNSKFELDTNFTVLRNCTNITAFNATKLTPLSNGNIMLRGVFKFTSSITGLPLIYDTTTIVIAPNGTLLEVVGVNGFGPAAITAWFGYHADAWRYIVDATNAIGTNATTRVYRYNNLGELDTTWSATGINYIPSVITTDKLGRLYTFSNPYNSSGWKVRGDRLNQDGTLDPSFTPIIFTITGSGQPLSVVQAKVDKFNQLFVSVRPVTGVSSIDAAIPVINGVPVVPGGTTQVYAYTPVFKFKETGEWDQSFANQQKNISPESSYDITSSTLNVNDSVLSVDGNNVNFLTNIKNPITGFLSRTPMAFDKYGKPIRLSGSDYELQVRWTAAKNMIGLMNGKTIVFGTAMIRNPSGGWNIATGVVAAYYQNGVTMKIVHNATRAIAGATLVVRDVVTTELEY